MQHNSYFFTMSDGFEVFVNEWLPDDVLMAKGVVQLHHGLSEHSLRYDRLGSVLTENNFILRAYDMRGHGITAENAEQKKKGKFGKLADKDGFERVVQDLYEMIEKDKKDFPGKDITLLGHSFGSFVSQRYIEKYGDNISRCILCGTAGPRPALITAGTITAGIFTFFTGKDRVLPLLSKLTFGAYNKKIKNPETEYDWLSRNPENIKLYLQDKYCGTPLTNSFYCDLMKGFRTIHKRKNMKTIPDKLPILFIYGSDDPVGDYGKSIQVLYNTYIKNGCKDISLKVYEKDRHELFNEIDKEQVEKDIICWINERS